MLVAVWIISGIVAALNLLAGAMKIVTPRSKQQERSAYVAKFSAWQIKAIGTVEVLAAIGLIVPPLTGILPIFAPLAAAGIVALQLGAIVVHVRLGEQKKIGMNIAILVLALFVALAGFGAFGAV